MHPAPAPTLFEPTRRRVPLAAALATAAFFLPQDLPLEWHSPAPDPADVLLLEITCAADQPGRVQVFYDATRGFNELHSFQFPIVPTRQTYTYVFPLPDAPITGLRLDPVSDGGGLTVGRLRILNGHGEEMRRFTRDQFHPGFQIAAIQPLPDGWRITSIPGANDPQTYIETGAPIIAPGMNGRNLQRCLVSTGYLALLLFILLGALHCALYRPTAWRELARPAGFMALLAMMAALVGNRGLIRDSVHYARFVQPPLAPGLALEFDLSAPDPCSTQLFWDTGQGFNEADSHRRRHEPHPHLQTVRFPLPAEPVRALRLDPRESPGSVSIRGIRVVDTSGRTRIMLPPDSLEAARGIAALAVTPAGLRVDTTPDATDPILHFTAAAAARVNRANAGKQQAVDAKP